jgi:NAD(P)-dependent dehydrogenase (short-subunit alcohol dehydrogenase family)
MASSTEAERRTIGGCGPQGIRANSVHPGFFETPMNPIPADYTAQ